MFGFVFATEKSNLKSDLFGTKAPELGLRIHATGLHQQRKSPSPPTLYRLRAELDTFKVAFALG